MIKILKFLYNLFNDMFFWISIKEPRGIYRWAIRDNIEYWFEIGYFNQRRRK